LSSTSPSSVSRGRGSLKEKGLVPIALNRGFLEKIVLGLLQPSVQPCSREGFG
jgi:hypothetical protein